MPKHPALLKHPPQSPAATLAWLDAALAGDMPANLVLLRRVRKLAKADDASKKIAATAARNEYWRMTVEDCERFPGVKSRRAAVRMAAEHLGVNENTLRSVVGPSPTG